MANLSQIFKNGQALQAKAGPLAINQNDVVALGGYPFGLYPVQVGDYAAVAAAGSSAVALTTYSSFGRNTSYQRNRAVLDPTDGSLFIADTYLTGPTGCQIWKYSYSGALIAATILDSTSTGTQNDVQMGYLSNGNIIVFWANIATPYTLYFAIVDKALNVIVAKTAIASTGTNPQNSPHMLPLSGGGFAVVYCNSGDGSYFTIRDSAGNIVKAPVKMAGMTAPTSGNGNGPRFKMAQLSNGNIVVASIDTFVVNQLQYMIYDTAGNVIVAYTALVSGSGNSTANNSVPEISVLPGYFCIASAGGKGYVFSNANAQQGAAIALNNASNGYGSVLINDGQYFWFGTYVSSPAAFWLTRISTAGAVVATATPAAETVIDMFFDRGGALVMCSGTNAYVFTLNANGVPTLVTSSAFSMTQQAIGNVGDFCVIGLQQGKFNVVKYLSASIFGIAQTAVAAGNAGALVTVNEGPGGYITNEIRGSVGKSYDHSSASPPGNKGVLFINSTTLKGI
ncbi:hypothetical protein [Pseudoduganella sp. RAF53_2]|uniref:hypothetical protein n=1 Tax=unclassified Pseudoduganella TaxID=2637179 RepID=UPI003F965305